MLFTVTILKLANGLAGVSLLDGTFFYSLACEYTRSSIGTGHRQHSTRRRVGFGE